MPSSFVSLTPTVKAVFMQIQGSCDELTSDCAKAQAAVQKVFGHGA